MRHPPRDPPTQRTVGEHRAPVGDLEASDGKCCSPDLARSQPGTTT
jgi:hypothetical protein